MMSSEQTPTPSPQPNDTAFPDPHPQPPHQPHYFPQDNPREHDVNVPVPQVAAAVASPPSAPVLHYCAPVLSESSVAPTRQIAPPRRTDHTYHDHAAEEIDSYQYPVTKKSSTNFPAKLHRMISDPMNSQAIQWQPHGRAWKVLDKELLVQAIIPKYFGQTKYESFTRQLSGWGFKRLHQTGRDYRCYYHECFLRGLPQLTRKMKRAEPNMGKLLPHVEAEPNFYEMDLMHPLPPPTGYHQPPPPLNYGVAGGAAAAGAYPYPDGHWPPHNAPYHYGHYHGHHVPPQPPNYPPHPYGQYPYPYPHQHPQQPAHPLMYPPQGQEHVPPHPPPYHGGYPTGASNAHPPPPHHPYGQPPPAGHPNYPPYNMYPNDPHDFDHQHHYPENYDPYPNQHAPSNNEEGAHHPEPDHHPHPGY